MSATPGITLGQVELTAGTPIGDAPYWFQAMGEDYSLGTPVPVDQAVDTLLQDGSKVVTTGHDNREVSFIVKVCGSDLDVLSQGETALFLECARPNTLTVVPWDGIGATTVFDVWTSTLEPYYDDMLELRRMERAYRLTLTCAPFGRSESEVVDAGIVATGAASVQINACDSLTGWTVSPLGGSGGTLSIDTTTKFEGTGSIKIAPASSSSQRLSDSTWLATSEVAVTVSGLSLDLTTTPFVSVTCFVRYFNSHSARCLVDGNEVPLMSTQTRTTGGGAWRTYYFRSTDAAVSSLSFVVTAATVTGDPASANPYTPPADYGIRIDDIRRSGVLPSSSSTGRESTRLVKIDGSARTQASLQISHETAGLGDVLVYTNPVLSPTGYTPELRRWRASGPATPNADANSISGFTETISATTPTVFEIPADPLPRGGYLLFARVRASGSGSVKTAFTYTVATHVGSSLLGSRSYTGFPASAPVGSFSIVALGGLTLPPVDVAPGSNATVQLSITEASGGVVVDELWVFAMGDDAALTQVACGTGAPALGTSNNRLWIDSPSVASDGLPEMWMGTALDRTDAYHAGTSAVSWTMHSFAPPQAMVFVANSGGANPSVSVRHFPRWMTHAGLLA